MRKTLVVHGMWGPELGAESSLQWCEKLAGQLMGQQMLSHEPEKARINELGICNDGISWGKQGVDQCIQLQVGE